MNWIVASCLMFCSSVLLYVFVRLASKLDIPTGAMNLAMFGIPMIAYSALAGIESTSFHLTAAQWALIALSAICFGYLGNRMSLASIAAAPNPGYSLALSKSYVTYTLVVSAVFFSNSVSATSLIAIAIIVLGSTIVMTEPKSSAVES